MRAGASGLGDTCLHTTTITRQHFEVNIFSDVRTRSDFTDVVLYDANVAAIFLISNANFVFD